MIIREFWGGRDWRFSTLAHSSYSARVATQQSHHLVCYSIIHFFLLFGSRFFSLLFLLTLNLHFCLISIIYYANEIRKLVTFLPFSFLLFSTFQQFALRKGTKKKLRRRKKSGLNFFSFLYLTDFSVKFFFFWSIPSGGSLVRLSDSQTDIQLSRHVRCLCSFGPRATSRNGKSTLGMELHFPTLLVFSSINTHLNAHSINALHWMRITMIIYFDSHWIVC